MTNLCFENYPVVNLSPATTVQKLPPQQQSYAYHLSLAAMAGAPIIFRQVNAKQQPILTFLTEFCKLFIANKTLFKSIKSNEKVDQAVFQHVCEYAGQFFYQSGNFLGFGDTKFVLRSSKEEVEKLLQIIDGKLVSVFDAASAEIYAQKPNFIGFGEGAQTGYFPEGFSKEDAEKFNLILSENKILPENNMVVFEDGKYKIMHFSAEKREGDVVGQFKGKDVVLAYGYYAECCQKIIDHLQAAISVCADENQQKMLQELVKYYKTGDMQYHLSYSKFWVQDANPLVETYQGFIETYRDPTGIRAEYEAFVACVDPDSSSQLEKLLEPENCQIILKAIPMPDFLHRKTFNPPTYKAIDIIVFPTTGMPIGINIPNYDEIRNNFGFKNVSLQNIMASRSAKVADIQFVPEHIKPLIVRFGEQILKAEVATHELFGHGSGALIYEKEFDKAKMTELTGFYKEGETFYQKFGDLQSAFEECRAEVSAFYLSFNTKIQEIFEFPKEELAEFLLTATYEVALGAVSSLIQYKDQWLQAHSQARFAILRYVMSKTDAIKVTIENGDIMIIIDEKKIGEVEKAYADMIYELNVQKASADIASARKLFEKYSEVDKFWDSIRQIAFDKRKPRKVFVSAVLGVNCIEDYVGDEMHGLEVGLVNVQNMMQAGVL